MNGKEMARTARELATGTVLFVALLGGCIVQPQDDVGNGDDDGDGKTEESVDQDDDTPPADDEGGDDGDDDDEPPRKDASVNPRDSGSSSGAKDAGTDARASDASTKPRDAGAGDASSPTPNDASTPPDDDPPDEPPGDGSICARWKADQTNLSEGAWTGNVASCDAGDMTAEARTTALRLVNLYRFMADLPALEMDAEGNRLAQGCALLMHANGTITHTPPSTWKCYTAEAAKTAGSSSVSSGGGVSSVTGYMVDPGNPTTIGHRRWILSNWLTTIGFGSTGRFSCQYQPVKSRSGGKPWVAWPPAGEVPFQVFAAHFGSTIDKTGWTVQSDSINLASAQVTVTSGGADLPVTVTQLGRNYGSNYAFRFTPNGWKTEAGKTYKVKVTGIATPIEYDVKVLACQ